MRYKMAEVLDALERNESVEILYHGKTKGIIQPLAIRPGKSVKEHRFFGMREKAEEPVNVIMEKLRDMKQL
jgi:hypothetical protein